MDTARFLKIMEDERQKTANKEHDEGMFYREKVLDFYRGNQEKYIRRKIRFDDPIRSEQLQYAFSNITRKIVNGINLTYINKPHRIVFPELSEEAREEKNKKYQKITIDKDKAMIDLDRYSTLVDNVGVKVEWNAKKNKFKYRKLIDSVTFALDHYGDEVVAVWFPVTALGSDAKKNEVMYEYWDKENRYIVDNDGNVSSNMELYGFKDDVNYYGIIPIVRVTKDGYYAKDIINANENINAILTEGNELIKMKSFGVPFFAGINIKSDDISFNSNHVLYSTNPDAKATMLNNNSQINDVFNALLTQLKLIAENYDISFDIEIKANVSGFSLLVQNIGLYDQLKIDNELKKDWERQIFEVENAVNKVDANGEGYGEEITIDFAEYELPIDQAKADAHEKHLLDTNQATPQMLLMKKNPELTQEDADEIVEKARGEKKLSTDAGTPTDQLTAGILG